jgi:predicted transcriptional regulator
MTLIKRSFNIDPDLAQKIDEIIAENPSFSFTILVNQALSEWVKNPVIYLKQKRFTKEDVLQFMEENSELMDNLGNEKKSIGA